MQTALAFMRMRNALAEEPAITKLANACAWTDLRATHAPEPSAQPITATGMERASAHWELPVALAVNAIRLTMVQIVICYHAQEAMIR